MSGDNFPRRYSVVAETRRKWSDAEKHSIVAEAERPGANISAVARRHGIKSSLLFRWRRLAREARPSAAPTFVPVTLALPSAIAPEASSAPSSPLPAALPDAEAGRPDDRIEIELGNGRLVRVGAGVNTDSLKRIIDLLDQPSSNGAAAGGRQRR